MPESWETIEPLNLDAVLLEISKGKRVYIDSETCGLHSIMVLWQFAIDDGPIHLYSIWLEPVWKTKKLFESLMTLDYVGFNLSFDHFHVAKIYTIWCLLQNDWIPAEHINEIVSLELEAIHGPCIKPKRALDLLLHSRKHEFQTLMDRGDIRIRRVPKQIAYDLAKELEESIEIPGIYFARAKHPDSPRWKIYDTKTRSGKICNTFKDVVLKFKPAGGLKFLAEYVLKLNPEFKFEEIEVDRKQTPPDRKLGFMPFAWKMAPGGPENNWKIYDKLGKVKGHAWPYHIRTHILHWHKNLNARKYAYYDIVYTRELDKYFKHPEPGDNDSELACMVGAIRWHGFEIDIEGMKKLCEQAKEKVALSPINTNAPTQVRAYICEALDDTESFMIQESTNKPNLIFLSKISFVEREHGKTCSKCSGSGCLRCWNTGKVDAHYPKQFTSEGNLTCGNHPGAIRAKQILDIKAAFKEVELYEKLIQAGRFHPDFNVIGTLSSRMSGSSGLNAQAIKQSNEIRRLFPLKWEGSILSGGDFDSFEVILAATVYKDKDLIEAITRKIKHEDCAHGEECPRCTGTGKIGDFDCKFCIKEDGKPSGKYKCPTCEGRIYYYKKIHALFGMSMYPGRTYENVMESTGTDDDMYTKGKSGVFGMIYGGDWHTLVKNFGIEQDIAETAEKLFFEQFPNIKIARQKTVDMFQTMKQVGRGQVIWRQPEDYNETFLGFKRYFTLENKICRALYNLAKHPPKGWLTSEKQSIKVLRNPLKGEQGAGGATMSALYGAAFSLQQQNARAGCNHEIQSPGGEITKHVQRKIWDLQPSGVHELLVAPLNIHDEIVTVNNPSMTESLAQTVKESVESFRDRVPLIGMTWNKEMDNWAGKKGGSVTLKISPPEMQN